MSNDYRPTSTNDSRVATPLSKFGTPRALIALDNADIRLIKVFMRVVEAGGLSAAQPELNLSLSTISEKIAALEQRLGIKLCKRGRSGFALTEDGRTVFEECQRLIGSLDQFGLRLAGLRSNLSGPLSLGIVDNMITDPRCPIANTVSEFVETAPAVHLTLETRSPQELLSGIVSQNLHVAVGSFPRASLGLEYLDLYDESQNFFCSDEHPLYSVEDSRIDIAEVRVHRIIARSYWAARDIKVFAISTPHATVSNMEAEAHLILSGKFLGYLPDHFAAQFVRQGRIRAIRPDLFGYKAKFQIATTEDWRKRPALRTFIELLQKVNNDIGPSANEATAAGAAAS